MLDLQPGRRYIVPIKRRSEVENRIDAYEVRRAKNAVLEAIAETAETFDVLKLAEDALYSEEPTEAEFEELYGEAVNFWAQSVRK